MVDSGTQSKIKALALELGFSNIGFAKIEDLDAEVERLKDWIGKKQNAGLDYLERNIDKRKSANLLVENADH